MTQALVFLGIVAGIFALIWAAQAAARKRGEAEAKLEAEQEARKTEQEMTDIVLGPTSPEDTRNKLDRGEF